jgi:predicted RNase H-like nuclease
MSTEHGSFCVAGVDGCKAGWFVAIASATKQNDIVAPHEFTLRKVFIAETFADVLSKTTDCVLVCIDIPIGLSSDDKPRQCDVAARKLLGPRASSVFPAPIRPCLSAADYETACKISFEHTGKKLSRQSFALLKKIREVDDLMTPAFQCRVREIHPEVSFGSLNGKQPMPHNKKTVPGQAQRHRLLQDVLADVDSVLAQAPTSGYVTDDALDALAAAWTAGRAVHGNVKTLPEQPELDGKGLRMEILCPAW